jgi:hypothetical protein
VTITNAGWMWNNSEPHSLLAEMQSGTATLEYSSWFLTKLNILLSYNPATALNELKNLCPHKNLHMDVYNSFIHYCQNLEATKMSFSN